jgi:micrococcal nuclease
MAVMNKTCSRSYRPWIPSINVWLLAIILLLISGCQPPPDSARVTQVIDGDTIIIADGSRVRYIGIDTPELHPAPEAFGIEAWQVNRELVEDKLVRLERDVSQTDRYGRLLRYVYVDGIFVNAELVRRGLAQVKAYPPDTKYHNHLKELETEARQAGRGIWAK